MFRKEIEIVISILDKCDICLEKGMTEEQLKDVEEYYQVIFPIEFRTLLMTVLPISFPFYDWLDDSKENRIHIKQYLDWPTEGILFDIKQNSFWLEKYWGSKPESIEEQLRIAEQYLKQLPKLIPIYSHRYIPSLNNNKLVPIFSVYQTDIIYYGNNLWNYFENEFGEKRHRHITLDRITPITFWSDMVN